MAKLVSETYGEALFSLGMEKEIVDSLMDEIDSLWKILKENPGFSRISEGMKSLKSFTMFLKESFPIFYTVFWRC